MREALDIVDFAACDREGHGQRIRRQCGTVECADGNMGLDLDRPDRSGEHVLVSPVARAFRRRQRPVTDEIAHTNRRNSAFQFDGRRTAPSQRYLAGYLQRKRRAAHAQMIQNEFPRGWPPIAAKVGEMEGDRVGENIR